MATCDRNQSSADEAARLETDRPSADASPTSRLLSLSLTTGQIRQLSPIALAYVGDAVYELYMRAHYLFPRRRIRAYHQQVVKQVNADQQAEYLQQLLPHLTDLELDIVRRGRNASPKRPNRSNPEAYQQATALEALIGYLYLMDLDRLEHLMNVVFAHLHESDSSQEEG